MPRALVRLTTVNASNASGAGTNYLVVTPSGVMYFFFIERQSVDVYYTKSTDGGLTWRDALLVKTGNVISLAVWYDKWSGLAGDLIHVAYVEDTVDDILYRNLDTTSDTLSSETTVFAGATAIGGGALTIWRSRHGEIRVAGSIDAGTEDGAWSSTDVGATWADTIADPSEGATTDQYFGLPGWNADTADEMIVFVDASANGLSVKRYDDSANSWAESVIIADASFVDVVATTSWANVAVCVDLANSRNIVAAWTGSDTANADLRLFFITDTTITESGANVVLNSVDDQGLCAVAVDTQTGYIYVFYFGKSDGSETYSTAVNLYYKFTTDDGATWSAEIKLSVEVHSSNWLICNPRFAGNFVVGYSSNLPPDDYMMACVTVPSARAQSLLGLG